MCKEKWPKTATEVQMLSDCRNFRLIQEIWVALQNLDRNFGHVFHCWKRHCFLLAVSLSIFIQISHF